MIPGEFHILNGDIFLNVNRKKMILVVKNNGDRPIQIGSHFHFYEVNVSLYFNRSVTWGFRLNIPSGTAVRFEPGQFRTVELVEYLGKRVVYGFRKFVMGKLD